MRVAVLGGTGFIGRAISRHLAEVGHTVCVIHRGSREPDDLLGLQHIHVPREHLRTVGPTLDDFAADVVIDCFALTRTDAEVAATCLRGVPSVVLSSQDVYAAWTGFITDTCLSHAPLTEESPLRASRYLYASNPTPGVPLEYEKLDVEEVWGRHGATILRLPMVYGPHDAQCREGFLLRRLAAGRTRIPVGRANLRLSRMHVSDVALSVEAALHSPRARGQVINLGEPDPVDMGAWMCQIGRALGVQVELVRVSEDRLPEDLWMTGTRTQHVVADVSRAHQLLRCGPVDVEQRVVDSTHWHQANPTYAPWTTRDDARDDEALADLRPV